MEKQKESGFVGNKMVLKEETYAISKHSVNPVLPY